MPALPPDRPGCPNAPGGRRPLPDLAAIRLCRVPDSAPPYDQDAVAGEPGAERLPVWMAHRGAQAGEPGGTEPGLIEPGHPQERGPRCGEPQGRRPGQREGPSARDGAPGAPWQHAAVPGAPPVWQSRFAQALAEALAGSRPPRQMVPWTTEEALDRIQRLGPRLASAQRPRVRRVLTSWPAEGVMELAVVVGFGPRVKALAVRLERAPPRPAAGRGEPPPGRWVCTAVEAA